MEMERERFFWQRYVKKENNFNCRMKQAKEVYQINRAQEKEMICVLTDTFTEALRDFRRIEEQIEKERGKPDERFTR